MTNLVKTIAFMDPYPTVPGPFEFPGQPALPLTPPCTKDPFVSPDSLMVKGATLAAGLSPGCLGPIPNPPKIKWDKDVETASLSRMMHTVVGDILRKHKITTPLSINIQSPPPPCTWLTYSMASLSRHIDKHLPNSSKHRIILIEFSREIRKIYYPGKRFKSSSLGSI